MFVTLCIEVEWKIPLSSAPYIGSPCRVATSYVKCAFFTRFILLRISGGNVYKTMWARARGALKHSAREYVCAGISMLGEKLKETLLFNFYVEIYFWLDVNSLANKLDLTS